MKKRVVFGLLWLVVFLVVIYFGFIYKIVFDIFCAALTAIALYETLKVTGYMKSNVGFIISLLYGVAVPFLNYGIFTDFNVSFKTILTIVYFIAMLIVGIVRHEKISFTDVAFSSFMTYVLSHSFTLFSKLVHNDNGCGLFLFFILFGTSWLSDTGAYFAGSLFGKHKLCPNISPKKTVEGFIGGIVTAVIFNVIFCIAFNNITVLNITCNTWFVAAITPILAVASVFGDLSASLIKRSCDIKDFGNLIPGHGGIMDRFDSVLMVAPLLWVATELLPLAVGRVA